MKTILSIIGNLFKFVGAIICISFMVVFIDMGPKEGWKFIKDSFNSGLNYKF